MKEQNRLSQRLTQAKNELLSATTNLDLLAVRDKCRALQQDAARVKNRDIQVRASHLVCDAERAIVKANPPQQGARTDLKNSANNEVKGIRQMRLAHNAVSDAEYANIKRESTEPLTRSKLRAHTTPPRRVEAQEDYTDLVGEVLGEIDLMPAADDSLAQEWAGTVYMNLRKNKGLTEAFINKLIAAFRAGSVVEAIMLVDSSTDKDWFQKAWRASNGYCFPAEQRSQTLFYFGDQVAIFMEVFRSKGVLGVSSR